MLKAHNLLVIFVKQPRVNRVKTRLGKGIGLVQAKHWYRHQQNDLIQRLLISPFWQTVLAIEVKAGGGGLPWYYGFDKRATVIQQLSGTLSDKFNHIFCTFKGFNCLIIGSDIPRIERLFVRNAFLKLVQYDAVFGPSPDGGFWLIGFSKYAGGKYLSKINKPIRWSTEYALKDTCAALSPDASIGFINPLSDVDTAEDLALIAPPLLYHQ